MFQDLDQVLSGELARSTTSNDELGQFDFGHVWVTSFPPGAFSEQTAGVKSVAASHGAARD